MRQTLYFHTFLFFLVSGFSFLISPSIAQADCSLPVGIAGELEYDTTDDRYEYCDGTNWIGFGLDITTGLVSHWKLDEASGTTAADSVGANNGTLISMAPPGDWVSGKINNGLDFDGADDRVEVTNNASIDTDSLASLSVTAWIYPRTGGESGDGRIVYKADAGPTNDGWSFTLADIGVSNRVRFSVEYGTTTLDRITSGTVPTNQWSHVAVTWDKSTTAANVHIYINGVEATYSNTTNGSGSFTDTRNLYIGNDAGGYRTFDGVIDDVRFYSRVLSDSEVLTIYGAGVPADLTTGLVSHWKLDESGTTTTAVDSAGGYNGTLNNFPGTPTWNATGGVIGGTLNFDGGNDNISVAHNANLNDVDEVTIAAWIKPETFGTGGTSNHIINKGDWNFDNSYSFTFYSNSLRCNVGRLWSAGAAYATANFTTGQWYHVVCQADAGGSRIYVNGVQVATDADAPTAVTTTNSFWIGAMNGVATTQFDGDIDEVRIYNRVLTPTDIGGLYGLRCSRQGEMFYDSTNNVLQYCDGANLVPMGPSPGAGGAGCAAAGTKLAGVAGALQYDTTSNKMVYCDGAAWVDID